MPVISVKAAQQRIEPKTFNSVCMKLPGVMLLFWSSDFESVFPFFFLLHSLRCVSLHILPPFPDQLLWCLVKIPCVYQSMFLPLTLSFHCLTYVFSLCCSVFFGSWSVCLLIVMLLLRVVSRCLISQPCPSPAT